MKKLFKFRWWLTGLAVLFAFNFVTQIYLKPAEALGFLAFWNQPKTPHETWQSYGPSFKKYSTSLVGSNFLAALAQTESSGNPTSTPQWRWRFTKNWTRIFSPASSSAGLFQFTSGTFASAQKHCVVKGQVWDINSPGGNRKCWLNSLYTRLVPANSIELAAAQLHRAIESIVGQTRAKKLSSRSKRKLAAITHLCGIGVAKSLYRRGLKVPKSYYCGSHSLKNYLARIEKLNHRFKKISALY